MPRSRTVRSTTAHAARSNLAHAETVIESRQTRRSAHITAGPLNRLLPVAASSRSSLHEREHGTHSYLRTRTRRCTASSP